MKKVLFLLFFVVLGNTTFCQLKVENKAYQAMLNKLLDKKVPAISVTNLSEANNVILLDAREEAEYDVSHIEFSQWIGYETFKIERLKNIPKNKFIVVYCSVGYRSQKIVEKLRAAGFNQAYNLWGGIFEWVNTDKPVIDNAKKQTNQIHAYSPTWGIWCSKGEKVYGNVVTP